MHKIKRSSAAGRLRTIALAAIAAVLPCAAASNSADPNTATLSTLYNFTDLGDGGFPEGGLVMGTNGTLYGTTSTGGKSGWGTVFELLPPAQGSTAWTLTTLYDFTGGNDGGNPMGTLVVNSTGVLYGTTFYGGTDGYGTVYEVYPSKTGVWTQKVLYSFVGGTTDGANPQAGLTLNSNGVLYGTTFNGGSGGYGTVFEVIPAQTGWSEKVLYSFQSGVDGANPMGDLALDTNGTLYGTTSLGGQVVITNDPPNCTTQYPCTIPQQGTLFQLVPGTGGWTEKVLYMFSGGADGGTPASGLIWTAKGNLFGTASWGGKDTTCAVSDYLQGCGVIFEFTPPSGSGGSWTEAVLYTFTGQTPDGAHPSGNLVFSQSGILYGTTSSGGANVDVCYPNSPFNGCGSIFSVTPPKTQGGTWTKNNVIVFPGSPGGGIPNGVIINNQDLYGTTQVGGDTGGFGTVFEMAL